MVTQDVSCAMTLLRYVTNRTSGRWLFIIDGIITLPLAVMGYVFFPNLPQDGVRTWWTTQREHEISVERMRAIGRAGKEKWTMAKFKSILLSWHTYFLRMY
jgi:peptidoglycan/LPS O-acetylase OafA/YrhL